MKHIKFYMALLCLILTLQHARAQQSYSYTQYINNPLPLNPAYSLINGQRSLDALTHNQWTGIDGAPRTLFFNGSIPLSQINGSVGLVLIQDKVTVESQTNISAFVAKAVHLSEANYLGVSISAGLRSFKGDYEQLSSTDAVFRNNVSQTTATAGISLMLYNPDSYYIGVSVPSFDLKKSGGQSIGNSAFYLNGAYLFNLNNGMKLKPALMAVYAKNTPFVVNGAAMLYLKDQFGLGAGYNLAKSLSGMVSYLFNNNLSISYSYQTMSNALGNGKGGTHEVGIGLRFGKGSGLRLL